MSSLSDRTFYFVLARTNGRNSVEFSRELDEPTDRAATFDLVKEMANDGYEIITISAFNPHEGHAQDITEDFAREWLAELTAEGHRFDLEFPPFIESAIGLGDAEQIRRECEASAEEDRRETALMVGGVAA